MPPAQPVQFLVNVRFDPRSSEPLRPPDYLVGHHPPYVGDREVGNRRDLRHVEVIEGEFAPAGASIELGQERGKEDDTSSGLSLVLGGAVRPGGACERGVDQASAGHTSGVSGDSDG